MKVKWNYGEYDLSTVSRYEFSNLQLIRNALHGEQHETKMCIHVQLNLIVTT